MFEEIQIVGKKKTLKKIIAKHLPEKYFIRDLILKTPEIAMVIGREEYEKYLP